MRRSFKHLLVTGGEGFIGSNFVRFALTKHPRLRITVLDLPTYASAGKNLADLKGHSRLEIIGTGVTEQVVGRLARDVDGIVNFAALTHVDRSVLNPTAFIKTNVVGTAILLEAARKHNTRMFIHISTDEVYGDVRTRRSRENDALKPRSPYSASKAAAEMVVGAYRETYDLPVVVLRGSNMYGPYQFPEKLIPLLITNAIDGIRLPLYNDGSAVRDYLYVADYCVAVDMALARAEPGAVYNVATGVRTSGKQIARRVLELLGRPLSLIEFVRDRPGHDYRYAPDASRISEIGWKPRHTLDEGLARTVRWYQEHEDWWRRLKSQEFWEFYRKNYRPLVR